MSNIETLNRAGRKPGATNLSTRRKEAMASDAVKLIASKLSPEAIVAMSPLDVLLACMAAAFQAGDLTTARQAASEAAPYCHARKTALAEVGSIPDDLLADPPPEPDSEDVPANPILG